MKRSGRIFFIFLLIGVILVIMPSVLSQPATDVGNIPEAITQILENSFSFQIVKVNDSGEITLRETRQVQTVTVDLGNDVSMEFVPIPGGSFIMGSPETERYTDEDERPQHEVTIQPFYLGKYEVTQAQYEAIIGNNPSRFKGRSRPVEKVSWNNAVKFCQNFQQKTGLKCRLPTEAEWEYATRAETSTPFYFGETITGVLANYKATYTYASEGKEVYKKETTPVGEFPPNAFGLYDMHGNVWEWLEDDWHNNYQGAPNDGSAWINNSNQKILRGGAWIEFPQFCRSAYRYGESRDHFLSSFGFRVILLLGS